jgi:hypothetical protein
MYLLYKIKKVKFSYTVKEAYRGSGAIATLLLNLSREEGEWSSCPSHFTPRVKHTMSVE